MTRQTPDEPRILFARYFVLAWLCSAAAIAYVHRFALGAAESSIRTDFDLSFDQMGTVLSSFFWGYAIFQVPSGWLTDRWGTRRLLSLLSLIWSLAIAVTPFAQGFFAILALRILSGCAQAGIFCCATRTISQWFPSTERGMTSGFLASSMSIGGAAGVMATGLLLPVLAWQWIFMVYAIPGIVWAGWFYVWFRDRPEEFVRARTAIADPALTHPQVPDERPAVIALQWATLLSSPTMIWIAAQQFFRAAGYIFYATWFATFLQESRQVSADQAALMTSLPLWAVVIGSPFGGIVSDSIFARTGSRRIARSGLAAAAMFICAVLTLVAYPVQNVWIGVLLISAGSFCSSLGGPCAYTVTIDVGGDHVGTVFSVMNMCGNIGAAVFPLVVPRIVANASWDVVFFFFSAIYVAAGLCWMMVDPDKSVFVKRQSRIAVNSGVES